MKQTCYSLLMLLFLLTGCTTTDTSVMPSVPPHSDMQISLQSTEKIIAAKANAILVALHNHDMKEVSRYVHPDKGLRFSSMTFVRESDLVFSAEQVGTLFEDDTIYKWGRGFFGDGDDSFIELTFEGYFDEFIYRYDFVDAEQIGYNEFIRDGNAVNNIFDFYPQSIVMEYYVPGTDPKYGGFDWASLRLVFQEEAGEWYLVGFVHYSYTP